jgi:hypothetical protein
VRDVFAVPPVGNLPPLYPGNPTYERLLNADVIVIDEYSMITSTMVNTLVYRLQKVCQCVNVNSLLTKCVILYGDPGQLPLVCSARHIVPDHQVCVRCHISSAYVWHLPCIHRHYLSVSYGHARDAVFLCFLQLIRQYKPTKHEVDCVLGQSVCLPVSIALHLLKFASYNTKAGPKSTAKPAGGIKRRHSIVSKPIWIRLASWPNLHKKVKNASFRNTCSCFFHLKVTKNILPCRVEFC